jgi:hypothetical protein
MADIKRDETETGEPSAPPPAMQMPNLELVRKLAREILREQAANAESATPFIDFLELNRRLPMYAPRTLRTLVQKGVIPAGRPPGSRKLAFFWPAVVDALKRHQVGGLN